MPDLKSELEKVINAWEQPEPQPEPEPEIKMETTNTPVTAPTSNQTENLFEYIKANPGKTAKELVAVVPQLHQSSVSSLLSAMLKRHLIRKVGGVGTKQFNGTFEVCADGYMSPSEQLGLGRGKRRSVKTKRKTAKRAYTRRAVQVEQTIPEVVAAQPAPAPVAAPVSVPLFDLNNFDFESLTIGQARALRDKLNALFGA